MKIRASLFALATATVGALAASPAGAQGLDLGQFGMINGTAAIMSDYVFRGASQTRGGPALQAGLEWTKEVGPVTPYFGTFLSNVVFPDISSPGDLDAHYEWDLYGGVRATVFDKLTLDVGYIHYGYPGANYPAANSLALGWNEVYGKAAYDFGFAKLGLGYYHSKNYSVGGGDSDYYSSQVDVPLPIWELTATGHLGKLDLDNENNFGLPDYLDWSLGVSRSFEQIWGTTWSLTYYDTNVSRGEALTNKDDRAGGTVDNRVYNTVSPRIVLAVTKAF
jgi:uncharacterized protein (TIGR02001 family)